MLPNRRFFELYGPYLHRPALWPEIWRREFLQPLIARLWPARSAVLAPAERTRQREAATRWCTTAAVGIEEALRRIGCEPIDARPLAERFPEELEYATRRAQACPMSLGGPGNSVLLYELAEHLCAVRAVETGVAYGWSSLALLLSLRQRPGGRLYSVDLPYFRLRNDAWVGCVVPAVLRRRWTLYRMADREALPRVLRCAGAIDLAHYDSDKSPAARAWAYARLWRALRPGGILVSDDVGDNLAFRDFCEHCGTEPIIVHDGGKYQGLAVKSVLRAAEPEASP